MSDTVRPTTVVRRRRSCPSGWVASAALVGVVLGGCAGVAPGPADDTDPGSVADQQQWMTQVCTGLSGVVEVATAQRTAEASDLREAPRILAQRVREVQSAVAELTDELDRLGPPPVPDGERVHRDLVEEFTERRDALGASAEFVEQADPSGTIGYVQVVRASQSAYTAGPRLIREVSRQPELTDAFLATPACRALDPEDADGP